MLGNVPAPRDLPPSASATGELAALAPHVERIRAASASAPVTRRRLRGLVGAVPRLGRWRRAPGAPRPAQVPAGN